LGDHWTLGTPFSDGNVTAFAADVIPVFPDDQKAIQLRSIERATTVPNFFEILAITQAGSTTFFFVGLTEEGNKSSSVNDLQVQESTEGVKKAKKEEGSNKVTEILDSCKFSSVKETLVSTSVLLRQLESEGEEGKGEFGHHHFLFAKEATLDAQEEPRKEKVSRPPPINNLQGLIKRKKAESNNAS
jgi:hypothetical protein